jgi:hypothetical protein
MNIKTCLLKSKSFFHRRVAKSAEIQYLFSFRLRGAKGKNKLPFGQKQLISKLHTYKFVLLPPQVDRRIMFVALSATNIKHLLSAYFAPLR